MRKLTAITVATLVSQYVPAFALSERDSIFLQTYAPIVDLPSTGATIATGATVATGATSVTSLSSPTSGSGTSPLALTGSMRSSSATPPTAAPATTTPTFSLHAKVVATNKNRLPGLFQDPVMLSFPDKPSVDAKKIPVQEVIVTEVNRQTGAVKTISTETNTYKLPDEALDLPEHTSLIALSFNLARDVKFNSICARFIPSNPADFKILAIFPTHEYLSSQFEHTNEFGVSGTGGFAPYGSVTVHDTDTQKTSYGFNRPLIYGLIDSTPENPTVQWNFLRQGKQHIDPGIVTMFAIVQTALSCDKIQVLVSEFTSPNSSRKLRAWDLRTVVALPLKQYRSLHSSELPSATTSFINSMLNTPAEPTGKSFKVIVEPPLNSK